MLDLRFRHAALIASIAGALMLQLSPQAAAQPGAFSEEKAAFAIKFKEHVSPYKIIGTYLLPHEKLALEAVGAAGDFQLSATAGHSQQIGPRSWIWQAPAKTGLYPVTIRQGQSSETITLNVFVMVPYSEMRNGSINGYRIGQYPDKAATHSEVYKKPAGFIEVTKENKDTYIAPHFQLKQFLCKQTGGYPKYVVLQEKLLLKLEMLLAKANEKHFRANTFTVMSGYRTPAYNKSLGNVKFSAHQFGMAADIYIDSSNNGVMDDLNRDGSVDYHDAETLYNVAEQLHVEPGSERLIGGLGKYRTTKTHGPFVHVDVRGYKARWG